MTGRKDDAGKLDFTLLTTRRALEAVVRVLEHGEQKYSREGWRKVPDLERRYLAAAVRHLLARLAGQLLDPDSGLPHLAHAACCLLFILDECDG